MKNDKTIIRKRIKEKFKTIENFSRHTGIPRTTINFLLKKGVNASDYEMVTRIFNELDIVPAEDLLYVFSDSEKELLKTFQSLDAIGKFIVSSVAKTELNRLNNDSDAEPFIAAYGSLSSSSSSSNENNILELVKAIKETQKTHE